MFQTYVFKKKLIKDLDAVCRIDEEERNANNQVSGEEDDDDDAWEPEEDEPKKCV